MNNPHQAQSVRQLPLAATVEEMSEAQKNEIMDMETHLTVFQANVLMEMAANPHARVPLWGRQKKEDWAKSLDMPLYYAPSMLEEMELREFLQFKELERMKLIRLSQRGAAKEFWQLTARGRLVAIWSFRVAADYQALMDHKSTTASA